MMERDRNWDFHLRKLSISARDSKSPIPLMILLLILPFFNPFNGCLVVGID
ncbi:hypothetical protein QN277_024042 [Acacia crassicarpa]|uniref:Transmembrane protein n=1 Tax=Acacia crassicarpa TaxID=499986 RepID=A0AAE1MNL5_9FABA|nr:hypothetical protein QN277_024042 [Acacia crassicarpa]